MSVFKADYLEDLLWSLKFLSFIIFSLSKKGDAWEGTFLFWYIMHFYVKQIFWNAFTQNFITYVTTPIPVIRSSIKKKTITVILEPSPQSLWQKTNLEV